MRARSGRYTLVLLTFGGALVGCAPPPPPPAPPPKPIVPALPTDTVRIPLTDLLGGSYYGNAGGLYPGGSNQPPADHDSAARTRRNSIKPLDVNGDDSPFGKYVLLAIGGANVSGTWCSASSAPPCAAWTFMGKAAADPSINHYTLVVVNGAADSLDAPSWTSPASPAYDRVKIGRLAPLGLSENQVQAVWVNLSDPKPTTSLPADSADAFKLLTNLSQVMRALRVRYPNLRLLFVSSAPYGGYVTTGPTAEPYAYESGFSVKALIESQIGEMRGRAINPHVGSLEYTKKVTVPILWGAYTWANGSVPRSDGVSWTRADFANDGIHLSQAGESKIAGMLIDFFKTSPNTRCWFLVNQVCL
jgi:hypothetical protein